MVSRRPRRPRPYWTYWTYGTHGWSRPYGQSRSYWTHRRPRPYWPYWLSRYSNCWYNNYRPSRCDKQRNNFGSNI